MSHTMSPGKVSSLVVMLLITACRQAPEATQPTAEAPAPVQATPAATAVRPFNPNFHEIKGNGVSLFLPPGYEGGNPQADIEEVAERLDGAGAEYDHLSQALRETKEAVSLIAFDTQQASSGFVTNVNVASQALPRPLTAREYIDVLAGKLRELEGYTVRQIGVEVINDNEVGRLVVEIRAGEVEIVQLFYAVPNNQQFWLVRYSTPKQEFERRRRDFEQSILTFQY